jgi:hypothetical protein
MLNYKHVKVLPSFCRSECYIHRTVCSGKDQDVLTSSQVAAAIDADTYSSYHSNSWFPQML